MHHIYFMISGKHRYHFDRQLTPDTIGVLLLKDSVLMSLSMEHQSKKLILDTFYSSGSSHQRQFPCPVGLQTSRVYSDMAMYMSMNPRTRHIFTTQYFYDAECCLKTGVVRFDYELFLVEYYLKIDNHHHSFSPDESKSSICRKI